MSKKNHRRRFIKHLGRVLLTVATVSLMTSPALATEGANQALSADASVQGSKKILRGMGKLYRVSKKPLFATTGICLIIDSIPAPGAPVNPVKCVAAGVHLYYGFFGRA